MREFGIRLKKIRCALNLSQEALGDKLNMSRAAIAAAEAGKNGFSQDTLYKLSKIFNINLNYLISNNGEMFISSCENTHIILKNDKSVKNFKNWGDRLTNILTENNLTPHDFSKLTSIKESRIDRFILDSIEPTIAEINAIKNNVDVCIDELLYGENTLKCTQTNEISLSTDEILKIKKMLNNSSI